MGRPHVQDLLKLETLARDKTASGREVLVGAIGDLFSQNSAYLSDRERALMSEILRKLIQSVEKSVRKMLSERLVVTPNVPHELIVMLANDEIDVAYPMLVNSGELIDSELIEIIRDRTLEHQLAIAVRSSLSEQVSDALVATGNPNVIQRLLENKSSDISDRTVEYLVEESERVDRYQYPLVHRHELSPELAARMYRFVSEALRTHLMTRFVVHADLLNRALDATVQQMAAAAASHKSKAEELADRLHRQGIITPALLVSTLREAEISLFAALFARFASLSMDFVRRIMFEPGGESLTVICKASGIDRATFTSIHMLTRKAFAKQTARPLSEMAAVLSFYDRISAPAAGDMLLKWQTDPKTGAVYDTRAPAAPVSERRL